MAIFAITAVVVKPIVGFVADRFFGGARKKPIAAILGIFAASLILFGRVDSTTAFMVIAPLLGAASTRSLPGRRGSARSRPPFRAEMGGIHTRA
ncbi:hypothetical protein IQ251_00425 [Saccharopolyspora sp. HNM0983]|uniref:Uncharacterized protein n=1 Tax=Saccharopolyspora montiporae TaxID=2781240 RepID=A0A929B809_9PSEU|nr:hypothetical protein [Saccharopolyspora sp. HNM0983]